MMAAEPEPAALTLSSTAQDGTDDSAGLEPAPAPGLGDDEMPDEVVLRICSFLGVRELGRLACVSQRFAERCIAAPSGSSSSSSSSSSSRRMSEAAAAAAAAAPEMLSIVEEAARRRVSECSEQERGWLSWRGSESWLFMVKEVEVLRLPLVFDRAHADISVATAAFSDREFSVATQSVSISTYRTAASKAVMRSGSHYAQFTILDGSDMSFGVIQPGYDLESVTDDEYDDDDEPLVEDLDGHCFYRTDDGYCHPGRFAWEGMQTAWEGDCVGMLLDLDQGSMSIWKNGEKLGVMQRDGLSGPLCWAVTMASSSARIESAAAPISSTEEELQLAAA